MRAECRHRPWLNVFFVVLLLALLTAWPTVSGAGAKKELIIGQAADIQKFDPHMGTAVPEVWVTFNIFDHLVSRGVDNKLKPALATEWKSLNNTTWQFKLRRGVRFHNGEPFNAETVKFSLGRTLPTGDPKVVTKGNFTTVDRIDVVDEYTVNFVTKGPDPLLPDRLAHYGGQIIPKQYFEKVGADEFNVKPVGTGPLKFVEWVKDDHHTLEANKDWWGGKIAFEKVIFRPIPEPAARVAALIKGEIDIANRLSPDDVDTIGRNANITTVSVLDATPNVLVVPYTLPFPLNNKYFHQALSLAIDRQSLVKDLFRGKGVAPNGFWATVDWTYDPSQPSMEYNPAKAKEMLKKAGYKGEEVILECAIGLIINDKPMSEAIIGMWRDVGINARMEVIEYSVRAQKVRDKSFKGPYWVGPTSILNDPDGHAYRMFGPKGQHDLWRDAEWDRLMQDARTSLDQTRRRADYAAAHKILMDQLPYVPVIQPMLLYGIQKYIDWQPRSNNDFAIEDVRVR